MLTNDEIANLLARARAEIRVLKMQAATLPQDDADAVLATLERLTEESQRIARAIGH